MSMDEALARVKLHARLHDPAEKALVLLRDPAGHEGGTTRTLHAELLGDQLPPRARDLVKRADRWASAADRPQFPRTGSDGRYARWTQVSFAEQPVIKHPLSGEALDLRAQGGLRDTNLGTMKEESLTHFRSLVHEDAAGGVDVQRTLLAFWRFGPELRSGDDGTGLGELWRLLPADTRVPDHTIWDHLDLVSAFAGAFHGDESGRCALLTVSLGPVQEFIAAARSTSDLWAGSHLLARLSWEAMRVVCERLGPDAVVFPNLRGIPQVDLWLLEAGLRDGLFAGEEWHQRLATDANPLFSAALPNRFLAVVPAEMAQSLAGAIEARVRGWVQDAAGSALSRLLEVAEIADEPGLYARHQLAKQLDGFPEVHWSVVEYDALTGAGGPGEETRLSADRLGEALRVFHGADAERPGFLGSEAWSVLQRPVEVTEPEAGQPAEFYRPNPGVLYPAVHDLAERALAAAKSARPFAALEQQGFRCSLTGEAEWLAHDPGHLSLPPGKREAAGTLWARVAERRPAWARKGEHLGALSALKRLWPTLFCEEIRGVPGLENAPARFVVSTHTMALSTSLAKAQLRSGALGEEDRNAILGADRAALPWRLAVRLRARAEQDPEAAELLARLPTWLELERDRNPEAGQRALSVTQRLLEGRPETYYALLLMDGDAMGRWLSGDPALVTPYAAAFHPAIRESMSARFSGNEALQQYLAAPRAVSPGRHIAISSALNDFSGVIARWIVEERHAGRVLYAGGDDLMAMLPTTDLLSAMWELRHAYSGTKPADACEGDERWSSAGFVQRKGRIHLCMGSRATASMGAVVVHHQTPLAAALRELREAEQRAKQEAGRNAFSLSVLKRSGGALRYTGKWPLESDSAQGEAEMSCLRELANAMDASKGASRRAAYSVERWSADLPEPASLGGVDGVQDYLEAVLHHQFERHGLEGRGRPIHSRRLARLAPRSPLDGSPLATAGEVRERLLGLVGIAEFFARETRRETWR
ncbi:type III-B CRISPR-associated protein Cas10/Cmr2 [Aquisalimonas sp.]|uniref:type III-B CRISPR-associated protein Cas10/Cmr2 n=1 Tax=Aquisalimonas sp. TaxID=1872621 RepID=UPI0025C55FC0|nr:type III-B CRISPR-associated protein Cas10/Cmr2 [Aquisalimonas sp.]